MNEPPPILMRQIRWYPPVIWLVFIVALISSGIALFGSEAKDPLHSPIFYLATCGILVFCVLLASFVWKIFKHFLWKVDPATWITIIFILIVITSLGIAAVIFALFLAFIYYPEELQQELRTQVNT